MNARDCILIVDDNDVMRKLLSLTLKNNKVELVEARSAREAWEKVHLKRPKIVLLDIMMPGDMDGLEVCRKIKADPLLADTKVMLVTARGQLEDIAEGKRCGADFYLVKPFSPLYLIDALRELEFGPPQ
jgi:two-component system, OmpR family, phosphate regulon response regulator PhoB